MPPLDLLWKRLNHDLQVPTGVGKFPCEGSLFPVTDGACVLVWLGPLQEVQGEPAPWNIPDPLRCSPSTGTQEMLFEL